MKTLFLLFISILISNISYSQHLAITGHKIEITPLDAPTWINYGQLHYSLQKNGIMDKNFIHVQETLIFRDSQENIVGRLQSLLRQRELECLNDYNREICDISPRRLNIANFETICSVELALHGEGSPLVSSLYMSFGNCRKREGSGNYDLFFGEEVRLVKITKDTSEYSLLPLLEFHATIEKQGIGTIERNINVSAIALDSNGVPIWQDNLSISGLEQDFKTGISFKKRLKPHIWKKACYLILSIDYLGVSSDSDLSNNEKVTPMGDCLIFDENWEVDLVGLLKERNNALEISIFNLGKRALSWPFDFYLNTFDNMGASVRSLHFSNNALLEGFGENLPSREIVYFENECLFELEVDPHWDIHEKNLNNNTYKLDLCN